MFRDRSVITIFLLFFLALNAIGLIIFSSSSSVYGAPLIAPTAAPRPRGAAPTPTPVRRRASSNATEFRVCNSNGIYSQTIQAAVDAAQPGDVIKVAGGTYIESKPSVNGNLYISKTVYIYGGYNCSDWTTQNPSLNISTIRPITTIISVVDIEGQFGNTAAVAPTLDGFTITGGRGDLGFYHGGGIRIRDSNALINNNIITSNLAFLLGGGIWVQRGAPVIQNNRIENNRVPTDGADGGGVELEDTQATLVGNIIANNVISSTSGYGGGIDVNGGGPVTITNNSILTNTAAIAGTGYGGGISIRGSPVVTATLSNNIIVSNTGSNSGFGYGGGLYFLNTVVSLSGDLIQSNMGSSPAKGYGGGLFATGSKVTLDSARVLNNRAGQTATNSAGGGLDFITSGYTLTNLLVTGNHADFVGGVIADSTSSGMVVNNTLAANDSTAIDSQSPITLTNSIILSHTVGVNISGGAPISATFNDFFNNTTNAQGFSLDLSNLTSNPQLDATFHLNSGSPAIDAGTHTNAPDHDFDGEPRPMIGTSGLFKVDIGADERTGTAQVNRRLATQPADFTLIGPGNPQDNITTTASTGSNDWIGYAAWGGDINGDNRADLIVGAPNLSENFDNGPNDTGRVFAIYNNGTRRLGVIDLYTTTANLEVRSNIHQQHIAQSFATADLNGDGTRDLVIGASGSANFGVTGTVFVFQGGAGLSGTKTLSPTMQATWRFRSAENTGTFGNKNSLTAGKLNNDSIDDLVVAEGGASGPGGHSQAGAVFVFFGSSLPGLWDMRVLSASLTIFGPATNSQLSRVAVGDVNGDGNLDLIVRSATTAYVFYGPLSAGIIDLASASADVIITGLDGDWLAAGDVDGDGKADIILGRSNEVDVVRGGTLAATQAIGAVQWARFTGVAPTTLYSFDWNGDGKAEVLIGDTFGNRAFVVFGGAGSGAANILDRANWIITGEKTGDQFGYSFGGADFDNDGGLDLIIGSRSHSVTNHPLPHFDDAGAVYIFYGGPALGLNQKIYLPLVVK